MKTLIIAIAFALAATPALAQINIKSKLERKADETIDDLLFGKKKKGSSDTDPSAPGSTGDPAATYEAEDETDPLGGYTRQPVNYGSMSPTKVVPFRDLIDFLPDRMGGQTLSAKPEGATMNYGEFQYSMGMKTYGAGETQVRANIIDYLQTGSLLEAYTNQYEYESTDGMMKSVTVKGFPGWFSANYNSGESSMVLVVNQRFYVSVNGTNLSQSELEGLLSGLDLEKLPQAEVLETTEED